MTTVTVPNDPCGIAILKADPMAAMQTILQNDQKSLKDFPSEVNMLSMKETFSAFLFLCAFALGPYQQRS
ncbi:MAG: hypothetical protein HQK52_20690 [Oligoflexia bacterium]|nr:hypothetical protein [Oligoflexia bacterium]